MEQKPVTKDEADKLNKAIEMLRSFCDNRTHCGDCPFKKESIIPYGTKCKFGSFYPELWSELEIKRC